MWSSADWSVDLAEGAQNCAFTLRVADLAPGTYQTAAFAHGIASGTER